MVVFIGATQNDSSFGARARTAIAEYGIQDAARMALDNGCIYYGSHDAKSLGGDTILTLGKNQGLIAGKLLSSQNYRPVQFDQDNITTLLNNPQLCTTNFWGRYSGCLYNRTTKTYTLLRDPLGLSTLFYLIADGNIFFSNHLRMLYLTLQQKPALDMHYFVEYAINKNHAPARTSFEGIQELQPGMSLQIDSARKIKHKLLWNLTRYKRSTTIDRLEYEQELHAIIKRCLKSWFADSSGICLELSGGLDSSSLMILLRDLFKDDKKIVGINYFDSKTPSSNEIEYAQEVADACSCNLQFIDWQNSSLLGPLPSDWYPDRPSTFLFYFGLAQQLSDIANMNNCSDIINGQGGDHIFLAPHPRKALADYWIEKSAWSSRNLVSELSAINRSPWWKSVQSALRDVGSYYLPKHINPSPEYKQDNKLAAHLNAYYASMAKDESCYLDQHLKGHLPGKAEHIKALLHAVSFSDRNQRIPTDTFSHPLLFQPIVEHALQLPTYQSFATGYNRIVIRNIANRITPVRALWRHVKGETTGSMCKSLAQHASTIEELILEGHLVKQGLVNTQWLTSEISRIRHGASTNMWPLLNLLSAQIWINKWGL